MQPPPHQVHPFHPQDPLHCRRSLCHFYHATETRTCLLSFIFVLWEFLDAGCVRACVWWWHYVTTLRWMPVTEWYCGSACNGWLVCVFLTYLISVTFGHDSKNVFLDVLLGFCMEWVLPPIRHLPSRLFADFCSMTLRRRLHQLRAAQ